MFYAGATVRLLLVGLFELILEISLIKGTSSVLILEVFLAGLLPYLSLRTFRGCSVRSGSPKTRPGARTSHKKSLDDKISLKCPYFADAKGRHKTARRLSKLTAHAWGKNQPPSTLRLGRKPTFRPETLNSGLMPHTLDTRMADRARTPDMGGGSEVRRVVRGAESRRPVP